MESELLAAIFPKLVALAIHVGVPLVIGELFFVATYDWKSKVGHSFEYGTEGFLFGMFVLAAYIVLNSLGFVISLLLIPTITPDSQRAFYLFAAAGGIIGPFVMYRGMLCFTWLTDQSKETKRWRDEQGINTLKLMAGVGLMTSASFHLMALWCLSAAGFL